MPNNLIKTKNNYGYQHINSFISQEFIAFAKNASFPVMDIGAAFGIATLPCLAAGANVIAVDICEEHLQLLHEKTPLAHRDRLVTFHAHFPQNLVLNRPISGVLLAHVLSFLLPEELERGLKMLYECIVPGGKVFVINYTPYHSSMIKFIPEFLERKRHKAKWPGFIENKWNYSPPHELSQGLPSQIHLFDDEVLERAFREAGFTIEKSMMFGGAQAGVPEPFLLDGREWVGLVARKDPAIS